MLIDTEVVRHSPGAPESVTAGSCDLELLEALAARQAGAFEALVQAYQHRLFGLAWRLTGSREDAEEVVQDALLKAHRALYGSYTAARVRELALRPWLFAIALNTARNRIRGRPPSRSLSEAVENGRLAPEPVSSEPDPPAVAENHELRAALEQALFGLPDRYRTAVVLRMVEGLTYVEAGLALGRPVGTVKSDVHRGLRQLRLRLAEMLDAHRGPGAGGAREREAGL